MAVQFVTYDDKNMVEGRFYVPQVNSSMATALIEVDTTYNPLKITEINFIDKKYIEATVPTNHNIFDVKLFESVRNDNEFTVERDMTHSFQFTYKHNKTTGEKTVYTQSNEQISGRLVVIIKQI